MSDSQSDGLRFESQSGVLHFSCQKIGPEKIIMDVTKLQKFFMSSLVDTNSSIVPQFSYLRGRETHALSFIRLRRPLISPALIFDALFVH